MILNKWELESSLKIKTQICLYKSHENLIYWSQKPYFSIQIVISLYRIWRLGLFLIWAFQMLPKRNKKSWDRFLTSSATRRPRLSEIEQKVQKLEVDSLFSAFLAARSGGKMIYQFLMVFSSPRKKTGMLCNYFFCIYLIYLFSVRDHGEIH